MDRPPVDRVKVKAEHAKYMLHTFSTGRGTTWKLAQNVQSWFQQQQAEALTHHKLFETPAGDGGAKDEGAATPAPAAPEDPDKAQGDSGGRDGKLSNEKGTSGNGKGKHGRISASGGGKKHSGKAEAKKSMKGEPDADPSLAAAVENRSSGAQAGTHQDVQQLFVEYSGFEELHSTMLAYILVSKGPFL